MNKEYKDYFQLKVILVTVILSLMPIIMGIIAIIETSHEQVDSTNIVMEVQQKDIETIQQIATVKPIVYKNIHTYYLIDGNIKIKVSETIYNNTNIGDRICISENVYTDDRTNEIIKITYTYNN